MRKKLLLLAMVLLGLTGKAMADDFSFSGEIQKDKFGIITIYATVESNHYNGFEIHVTQESIPKGITIEKVVPTSELKETYPDIQIQSSMNPKGYFVVMGMTIESATQYVPIGKEIPIVNMYLDADDSYKLNDKVTLVVDHAEFSLAGQSVHCAGTSYGLENRDIELTVVDQHLLSRTIDENSKTGFEDSYKGFPEIITVKRTIKKDTWSTLCLPFALEGTQRNEAFGSDAKMYSLSDEFDFDPETHTASLDFSLLKSGRKTLTNTVYLIKTTKDIDEFTVENVVVEQKDPTTTSTYFDEETGKEYTITATGVYKPQVIPDYAVFLNNEKFYYSTGNSNIKSFRSYFVLDKFFQSLLKGEDGAANINIFVDGEATAIEGITTNTFRNSDDVYSISGVYMGKASDMKKLPRGMYIVNNKKVTIK